MGDINIYKIDIDKSTQKLNERQINIKILFSATLCLVLSLTENCYQYGNILLKVVLNLHVVICV